MLARVLWGCRESGVTLATCLIDYAELFHSELSVRVGLLPAFEYYTLMRVLDVAFMDARDVGSVVSVLRELASKSLLRVMTRVSRVL